MIAIGIDPGKSGSVAAVEDGKILGVMDCPTIRPKNGKSQYDERAMYQMLFCHGLYLGSADKIILEKVHAMPGQGVVSMFEFGKGLGIWLGILATQKIPYELITPQRWKKEMLRDIPGTDQKARSVIAAKRLYPDLELPRKKDHNKADAVLIATWGLRHA